MTALAAVVVLSAATALFLCWTLGPKIGGPWAVACGMAFGWVASCAWRDP